jgi:hypothetical protein
MAAEMEADQSREACTHELIKIDALMDAGTAAQD